MRARTIGWVLGTVLGVAAAATGAGAQQCDDFDACTVNDMCAQGVCVGTPQSSGSCDDFNDCTVSDRCGLAGCTGDEAPEGTPCGGGCGTCQRPFPFPGLPLFCVGNPDDNGKSCDPGLGGCLVGACQVLGEEVPVAVCFPAPKECDDTDGDPCTDNCNFESGRCERNAPKCFDACQTCNRSTGQCEAANSGAACDDFDPCTPESRCESGICMPGAPTSGSPTPTATVAGPTPTVPGPTATHTAPGATATVPPTSTRTTVPGTPTVPPTLGRCVGDCSGDGTVAVNEMIQGVNIALGSAPASQCPSFDTSGNGQVEVNELISGVNSLLNGCVA